ncbi:hypothetical protein TSUD_34290 [Trifolium subterraneum]|uniref:Helicase ATP-binding domain-containing protein n=1 Tax=Trifolium subterraneum TaxID=3900 RepID=A0A2Z6P3I7_TRISU|nr:hypothetical protein TSUD_34290 [Trifolium subterraneum]
METLKLVYNHRCTVLGDGGPSILAVGFASRMELCINSNVVETSSKNEDTMIAGCRKLTASWVREVAIEDGCPFFKNADSVVLSPGIYSIQDLVDAGKANGWCPYFVAKRALQSANIVVFGPENMLDPMFAGMISKELKSDSIVAFDNADHVDKFCTEALTVSLDISMLQGAKRNMERLYQEIERVGANDEDRLCAEYTRLKNDLKYDPPLTDLWLANPALPEDFTVQPMPGHIRRPEHFLFHLDLLCPFNTNFLRLCDERLNSLLTTLKIVDTDEFLCIQKLCHFATLWGNYFRMTDEFQITTGPCLVNYDEDGNKYYDRGVQLLCTDPSLVMVSIVHRFGSVCINVKEVSADSFTTKMNFEPHVCEDIVPSRRGTQRGDNEDSEDIDEGENR